MKYFRWVLLLSLLALPALADTQTFTSLGQALSVSPHVEEEVRILAELEADRLVIEQAATYLENLPQIKGTVSQENILPLLLLIYNSETFAPRPYSAQGNKGFEVKASLQLDTSRLPEDLKKFVAERFQNLEMQRRYWRYQLQLEQQLRDFLAEVKNAPERAEILKLQKGAEILKRYKAAVLLEEGGASFERERYDESIAKMTEALKMDEKFVLGYFVRGAAYFYKKNYDLALKDFSAAIALDPADGILHFARGTTYMVQGIRFSEAVRDLTKAIELSPNYASSYYIRGAAYANLKNCERAEADFRKACEMGNEEACKAECGGDGD